MKLGVYNDLLKGRVLSDIRPLLKDVIKFCARPSPVIKPSPVLKFLTPLLSDFE